jgi:hypothetical protein
MSFSLVKLVKILLGYCLRVTKSIISQELLLCGRINKHELHAEARCSMFSESECNSQPVYGSEFRKT